MSEHWTADEDLLGRFVRGEMDESERAPLAQHLGACDPCKSVVESEFLLAAGVRRAGRAALRARLRERLALRARRRITWPQMAAAAAIAAVIVGGVTFTWWRSEIGTMREEAAPFADTAPETPAARGAEEKPGALQKERSAQTEPEAKREKGRTSLDRTPRPPHTVPSAPPPVVQDMEAEEFAASPGTLVYAVRLSAPPAREQAAAKRGAGQALSTAPPPTVLQVVREASAPRVFHGRKDAAPAAADAVPCRLDLRNDTLFVTVMLPPDSGEGTARLLAAELAGRDSLILSFTDVTLGLRLPLPLPGDLLLTQPR